MPAQSSVLPRACSISCLATDMICNCLCTVKALHDTVVMMDRLPYTALPVRKQSARPLDGVVGDIDVVMGGPPCQGVSGLNRHCATENILKDGR